MITGMSSNLQALSSIAVSRVVTADNHVTANTDGFQTPRITLESDRAETGVAMRELAREATLDPSPIVDIPSVPEDGRVAEIPSRFNGGFSDLAPQMVHLISDSTAFSADLAAFRAQDDLVGTLLNVTA